MLKRSCSTDDHYKHGIVYFLSCNHVELKTFTWFFNLTYCSWSHGLSEYRILKFPENWVNLQSAKEELLFWWSLMTSFQPTYGYFLSTSLVSRNLTLLIHDKCGWDGDVKVAKIMINNSTRKQLNQNSNFHWYKYFLRNELANHLYKFFNIK